MIVIEKSLLKNLSSSGLSSSRLRTMHNFHNYPEDPIQRMINAIQPYSYVQPHRHKDPDKREAFLILQGSLLVIEFDDSGKIVSHIVLNRENGIYGVEIAPGIWHTILALEKNTAAYEIKDGPYIPLTDKDFAIWAPKEGDTDALQYNESLLKQLSLKILE